MISKFRLNFPEWDVRFRLIKFVLVVPLAFNGYLRLIAVTDGVVRDFLWLFLIPWSIAVAAIELYGLWKAIERSKEVSTQ